MYIPEVCNGPELREELPHLGLVEPVRDVTKIKGIVHCLIRGVYFIEMI